MISGFISWYQSHQLDMLAMTLVFGMAIGFAYAGTLVGSLKLSLYSVAAMALAAGIGGVSASGVLNTKPILPVMIAAGSN